MKQERYSSSDVERLLRELAEADRGRMDDAQIARHLSLIDREVARNYHRSLYRSLARYAAALVLMAGGLAFLVLGGREEEELTAKSPRDAAAQGEWVAERRAYLSQLESSTESGFSPLPQERYAGNAPYRYGVSVYGHYEYTACTDTL